MKKKTSIIIGVIVAIVIAMIGGGLAVSGILDPYEKQIRLGYKMMNEEKYEEAILAFNTAIEIDQKKEKAYIGLADTYVARCDESTVSDASDALKRGYEQSQSEKIVQGYINSAQTLYDKDKKDWAIELLEKGYKITSSEEVELKLQELLRILSGELLKNLFKLCENNDLEQVVNIMHSKEFKIIASAATNDNQVFYSPNSDSNNKNGKGIGIYLVNNDEYLKNVRVAPYFIYFGDYSNNIRSGDGIWLSYHYLFEGIWRNDKPNGKGKSTMGLDINQKYLENLSGNLIDGLWNGYVEHQMSIGSNGYYKSTNLNFNVGFCTSMNQLNNPCEIGIAFTPEMGEYETGYAIGDYLQLSFGIPGFGKEYCHRGLYKNNS